jgi:hypothetical protein
MVKTAQLCHCILFPHYLLPRLTLTLRPIGRAEGWLAHEVRRPEVESRFWAMLEAAGLQATRLTLPADVPCQVRSHVFFGARKLLCLP